MADVGDAFESRMLEMVLGGRSGYRRSPVHFHTSGAGAVDIGGHHFPVGSVRVQDRESICREELVHVRNRWVGSHMTDAVRLAIETEMRARLLNRGLSPRSVIVREDARTSFTVEVVFPRTQKKGSGRWRRAARRRARRRRGRR